MTSSSFPSQQSMYQIPSIPPSHKVSLPPSFLYVNTCIYSMYLFISYIYVQNNGDSSPLELLSRKTTFIQNLRIKQKETNSNKKRLLEKGYEGGGEVMVNKPYLSILKVTNPHGRSLDMLPREQSA